MTLTQQLKANVLDPLSSNGWAEFFAHHGLDITVSLDKLDEELAKPLRIDRTIVELEEFSLAGTRAVEPGSLARSFLYHALASPCCTPPRQRTGATIFPSLLQLDIVENYVYSRARLTLSKLQDPVLAVFAYQYRDRMRTTHRQHADVAFSRAGVARVGTLAAHYDGASRGYVANPGADAKGFRVLPARYALFVAERRTRGRDGTVLRPSLLDSELMFLFPVHKLFPGNECLFQEDENGNVVPLSIEALEFVELHVNEKLARVHDPQGGDNDAFVKPHSRVAFDLNAPPFVRTSRSDKSLVTLCSVGASCQVMPVPAPLVSTAKQMVKGKEEVVRFEVPKPNVVRGRPNRYWSTLEITPRGDSRAAPEYLNIRQQFQENRSDLVDLNRLSSTEFLAKVINGGDYEAAHFIDNTCDGALTVRPVTGINLPVFCAFSLVTAIDYFPLVDQVEVEEWIEWQQRAPTGLANINAYFPQGGPQPMSDGRFSWDAEAEVLGTRLTYQLPNCFLPHPVLSNRTAFGLEDPTSYTATAIIGPAAVSPSFSTSPLPRRSLSWLPDAAADVYAPGWDVSQHRRDGRNMMVSYGLGSPFPEDAKLCAALNSFWPAVAPDSSRTYGFRPPRAGSARRLLFTSLPLTDAELGYHPQHPRVWANEVESATGWDGDFGPYYHHVEKEGTFVNASNLLRADQTRAALDGTPHFAGLDRITTDEFISRIHSLSWCRENCEEWCRLHFDQVFNHRQSGWWLVSFEAVPDWETWSSRVHPKADTNLKGVGYIFVFALVGDAVENEQPPIRLRYPLRQRFEIHLSNLEFFRPSTAAGAAKPLVFLRKNDGAFSKLGS